MKAMVTSPHPLASAAGAEVLSAGGTAIEAAIAAGAVLAVVCPHFCGLGGDGAWMLSDENGHVESILGVGQAAAAAVANDPIVLRGAGSALTTAGLVDSWRLALELSRVEWGGRMDFASLLEPAERHARQGVAVSASQRFWLEFRRNDLADWPGFSQVFLADGSIPAAGELLYQPDLAKTLHTLRMDGPRAFYEGHLAERIAQALEEGGSPIRMSDLVATAARREKALSVPYRDTLLYAPPPPTQGLATLEAMGILDRFDPAQFGEESSAEHIHMVVEAIKQAFIDRAQIADRDPNDLSCLLSDHYLTAAAGRLDPQRALPWPHEHKSADTVFLGAVDAKGRCASVLQSTYFDWGSGMVVGDTGIIWHNRGAAFHADPSHINGLRGGRRPFHTLNPGLAVKDGRPYLVYGSQGADGQPQNLALLLTRMIDFGLSPQQALARPRFLLGKTFSDSRESLKVEEDIGNKTLTALERQGHLLATLPAKSALAGQAGAIRIDGNSISGAHDPRGEGKALVADCG